MEENLPEFLKRQLSGAVGVDVCLYPIIILAFTFRFHA